MSWLINQACRLQAVDCWGHKVLSHDEKVLGILEFRRQSAVNLCLDEFRK